MICFGLLSIRLFSSHDSGHEYNELTFLHVVFLCQKGLFFQERDIDS